MASEIIELILKAKDTASGAILGLREGMEKLSGAQQTYKTTLDKLQGPVNQFKSAMLQLGAIVGVTGLAKSFIDTVSAAEKTKIMLNGIMGSAEAAGDAFEWLQEQTTKTPFAFDSLSDAFVKLKTSGIDPMDGSLQTLTDSLAYFGKGSEDLKLAAVAIQQMAGKGVVSLEELRGQLGERIPTAIQAMAEGMGIGMGEFTKAISQGNISAAEGIDAMLGKLKEWYGGAGL